MRVLEMDRLRSIIQFGYAPILWLGLEFLPVALSPRQRASNSLCRLMGGATVLVVMWISMRGPSCPSIVWSTAMSVFALLLAVALGNIVKEVASALCGHIANWCGFDFRRTAITLGGTVFREVRRANGTWRRVELRADGAVGEWTDHNGQCHQRIFKSRFGWRTKPNPVPVQPHSLGKPEVQQHGVPEKVAGH
jgi:hypothetical protein